MVEMPQPQLKENRALSCAFAVAGVMITLVIYGFLQEKIMAGEYGTGDNKEKFTFSIFLVFCNRITTSTVSAAVLLATNKSVNPVAPIYKYCGVSITNIISTTCQYEALKFVSFPVQTLAKCAKMIPVMVWGTVIMQKRYYGKDYLLAVFVTLGCSLFILNQPMLNTEKSKRESTVRGVLLMLGYLGFDGFTSTFQDKLFKGYKMEIQNQIFFTTTCSCFISLCWLIFHGKLVPAIDFMFRHPDCFFDATVLSCVATASQFFISYTIRHFGALTFAIVMTTKQLVSIVLSCIYFSHPLDLMQWLGGAIVFGSLYTKNLLRNKPQGLPINAHQTGTSTTDNS